MHPSIIAHLISLIYLVVPGSGQQNPAISSISQDKVVNVGDTVDLECSVQYASGYPIIWAKVDQRNNLFISKGSSLSIPDNRYSIRHDEASSKYTLQISKIQETDAGTFQCQIVLGATSKVTANVRMIVIIPPLITDNSTRSVRTSTGGSISLECYAIGNPKPKISWRRQNNDILPTGGTVYLGNILTIHNITKNDRGTYYCIADNGVGRGAKRNIGVEIEFKPKVRVNRPAFEQALNHPVDLECRVEAFPTPSIIWLKDGYELANGQHYKITELSTTHEFTDSVLRVHSIKRRQFGTYTCRAINKLGIDDQRIELLESAVPICPPACSDNFNDSNKCHVSLLLILLTLLSISFY